jgi:hypothetical protein
MGLCDRACPGRRTIRFGPGDVCHSRVVGNAAIRETNRCAIAVRQLGTAQITPLTDAMEIENLQLLPCPPLPRFLHHHFFSCSISFSMSYPDALTCCDALCRT